MGSSYFAHRISAGEIPTRITLPNTPALEYGRRKGLTSLVPLYIDPYDTEPEGKLTKIYFAQMAIAVQDSRNDWLEKVLSDNSNEIPLKDEATGTTLLHIAAKACNETTLNILLKHSGILQLLNEADFRGTTPLIVAAWYGNFAALKYFLALGCETMSIIKDTRKNALHCAADLTDTQICTQLLKYNTRPNFIDAIDDEGYTPLMIAVRGGSPCVTILLMFGADYRYQSTITGRNILHLAIVFFQHDTLLKLLRALNDSKFISAVDYNGDNAFMLAVRLQNYVSIKTLISNIPIKKLLNDCPDCIHYIIKHDYSDLLGVILAAARNVDFLDWTDNKGRTPLMYAVEIQRTDYVSEILLRQKNLWHRNPLNGETVLHLAAYTSNAEILKELLNTKGVDEIIDVVDNGGRTAYEIVLGRADLDCYFAFKNSGHIIPEFVNIKNESSLFIAAKLGNYNMVLNVLLSEKFLTFHQNFPEFTQLELVRAELQGRIYSSDTYIICGKTLNLHAWNRVPKQEHLFRHNVDGKNIFHACTAGGNLMCLAFIYSYCIHFNKYWQELDLPDNVGTTPLLYAANIGEAEFCKFFIHHGANITAANSKGQFPLMEMTEHLKSYKEFLLEIITECVVEESSKRHFGLSSTVITVSYHMFCPPGLRQLYVISKMFEVLKGEFEILNHPVLEYFIQLKWIHLKYIIAIRLYVNLLTVLFTYMFMSVTFWSLLKPLCLAPALIIPTSILSVISILFNIPYLFIESLSGGRRIFSMTVIASPICTLLYLSMQPNTNRNLAVGAVAVLTAGISLFIHSIDTFLSHQISMFHEVLTAILSYLPLCFILLLSFSFCFFVLYHDTFNFNNPAHSFLYSVMVLLEGDTSPLPTFQPELSPLNSTALNTEDNMEQTSSVIENFTISTLEGVIQILFKILITLTLLNMLIGLSVKGASELEKRGNIQTLKTKVDVLNEWESFSYSKFYIWLTKFNLHFIFGLVPNLRNALEIPAVLYPHERPVKSFDIVKLQNIALKPEQITSISIQFLAEKIGYHQSDYLVSNPPIN